MNHARLVRIGTTLVASSLLTGGLAFAQPQPPQLGIPLDQARTAALVAVPGTILEAQLDRYAGRNAYEFKVQPESGGLAVDVHVDAATGEVLGTGGDTERDNPQRLGGSSGTVALSAATPAVDQTFQDDFNLAGRTLSDTGESRYFILRPGYRLVLADGASQLTITVLNETRDINGTATRVVEERLETASVPTEIALNFFAIDPGTGDVFYFGEEVDEYSAGILTGHPGAWTATGNNRPGLVMPGSPVIGMRYYQEVAPGIALDRAEVLSISETCVTPAGEFAGCLVTRESSALEAAIEQKSYAPGIGLVQDQDLRLVSHGFVDPGR